MGHASGLGNWVIWPKGSGRHYQRSVDKSLVDSPGDGYRPAPIQVSWLAYPGTTGADYMDYVIADRFVLPTALQQHFVEKAAYLPRCYWYL